MKDTRTPFFGSMALAALCFCTSTPTCAGGLVAAWGEGDYSQVLVPGSLNNVKALGAGWHHTLALRSDGTVVAWGANFSGQAAVPEGLTSIKAVAAGDSHSLGLRAGGLVVGWGYNGYGQTSIPASASNVVAIAAGGSHSLALRADGTVVGWGDNSVGQSTPPADLRNVAAIAAGETHSLALKGDGTVVGWGGNGSGQISIPPNATNVVAIEAGYYHSLALSTDGTIIAWGNNTYGQTSVPANATNIVAVAAGNVHNLALRVDGSVVGWGNNFYGQATAPSVLSRVTAIAAGGNASFAVVFDGPIQILQNPQSLTIQYPSTSNITFSVIASGAEPLSYRWRRDGYAVAGDVRVSGATNVTLMISNAQPGDSGTYAVVVSNAFGSVISSKAVLTVISSPFIISQSFTNLTVGAGADVTFSVLANGTPPLRYQWFLNETIAVGGNYSTLGVGNVQPHGPDHYSVLVTNIYGTARANFSLTVTDSPPYVVRQPYVRLPNQSTTTNPIVPVGSSLTIYMDARGSLPLSYKWRFNGTDIPAATNLFLTLTNLQLDQTGSYSCAIRNAFGDVVSDTIFLKVMQVWVWGATASGASAYPPPDPYTPTNVPPGLTNVIALAGGAYHLLALKPDGRVVAWGNHPTVTAAITNVPASATNAIAVAAAGYNCAALRSNGTVIVWGNGPSSLTNVPAGTSNVIAIVLGESHCLALRSNGTVIGWGNNSYGQLSSSIGLSNVIAIAAGSYHSLALKADGTVVGWGLNTYGQTNPPAGLSNVVAIDAAGEVSLALKADGTAVSWGNPAGQIPATLTNLVATSLGQRNVALKSDASIASWYNNQTLSSPALSNVISVAAGERWNFSAAAIGVGPPIFIIQPSSRITTRSNTVSLHARAVGVPLLRYQWQLDGAALSGATNASLTITNVQAKDTGGYRIIVVSPLGAATSVTVQVTIPFNPDLAAALNTPTRQWVTTNFAGSAQPWFAQIRETHDGNVAAQSGRISDNQQSVLYTPSVGPGTLTFWWKVSSEAGYDFLKFLVDGSVVASISGEMGWQQKTIAIPADFHALKWVYTKDASVSSGQDAGWLDEFAFTLAPMIVVQPTNQIAWMGQDVVIWPYVGGPAPLSYQWLKAGTDMPDATQLNLTLPRVTRRDSGAYTLRVTNPGGSVTSSNATLKVIVQQRLGPIRLAADGSIELLSRDADDGLLLPRDLPAFEALASTNLVDWETLPNAPGLTNGALLLRDLNGASFPKRFYRVLEH